MRDWNIILGFVTSFPPSEVTLDWELFFFIYLFYPDQPNFLTSRSDKLGNLAQTLMHLRN